MKTKEHAGTSLLVGGLSASLALGAAGMLAPALADEAAGPIEGGAPAAQAEANAQVVQAAGAGAVVEADATAGAFAYDQTTITPTEQIATTFRGATATLCQATEDFAQVNPLAWQITVSGAVDEAFTADVGELSGESAVSQVMTCTCGGNPADGRAIITADVKGIPVSYLLDRAQAQAGVNTLVFVASDGCEVALPLGWVVAHHAVVSYQINGEDLSASVGGNNQLWMAGASANYFVRDIVEIRVEARPEAEVPAEPGVGMDYPNSPNAGVLSAQVGE